MRRRHLLPLVAGALALTACGAGGEAAPPDPPATVPGVGELPPDDAVVGAADTTSPPEKPDRDASTTAATTTPPARRPRPTTTTSSTLPPARPVGDDVAGNRLLVIGDSIMASTAQRYGGEMCRQLVPQGWAVEVDAETGQRIQFAKEVLGTRLRAGWDAVAIMLGNNYDHDPQAYADVLEDVLEQIGDRPVLLYTVTQFRDEQAEVNYVIGSLAQQHDNVRMVDWAGHTDDAPQLLGDDGLHLSDAGRQDLVALTAYALGRAPAGSRGECLSTRFADDSATRPTGG